MELGAEAFCDTLRKLVILATVEFISDIDQVTGLLIQQFVEVVHCCLQEHGGVLQVNIHRLSLGVHFQAGAQLGSQSGHHAGFFHELGSKLPGSVMQVLVQRLCMLRVGLGFGQLRVEELKL